MPITSPALGRALCGRKPFSTHHFNSLRPQIWCCRCHWILHQSGLPLHPYPTHPEVIWSPACHGVCYIIALAQPAQEFPTPTERRGDSCSGIGTELEVKQGEYKWPSRGNQAGRGWARESSSLLWTHHCLLHCDRYTHLWGSTEMLSISFLAHVGYGASCHSPVSHHPSLPTSQPSQSTSNLYG